MTAFTISGALTKMASNSSVATVMFLPVPQRSWPKDSESGAAMRMSKVTAVARVAELMVSIATTSRMSTPTGRAINRINAG